MPWSDLCHGTIQTTDGVTYKEESYYKEYRILLNRVARAADELKFENEKLLRENTSLSKELREVRALAAELSKEAERLRSELEQRPETQTNSLFEELSDTERIALKQEIGDLIGRIDKHLSA